MIFRVIEHTLVGKLYLLFTEKGLAYIAFSEGDYQRAKEKLHRISGLLYESEEKNCPPELALSAETQLLEYLDAKRKSFDIPLDLRLTVSDYQRRVLNEVAKIPYGYTSTYGKIAETAGGTARSVGTANAKNPISIVIPCHRVLGGDGHLRGYGGGIPMKEALLRLEANRLI